MKKLYEGKAKILYESENNEQIIQYFKDDTTAFNNQKFAINQGKGELNNIISSYDITWENIFSFNHYHNQQTIHPLT
jgi:phosphoribosylaminoimidazole-succinocarboxamide synthase